MSVRDGKSFLTVKGPDCADCLVEFDPKTGALVKNWGPLGYADAYGLAFWGGELYAFTEGGEVVLVKLDGDKATIVGKLTLHGTTKDVTILAERVGGGADPWGGYREGFTGTTSLALKDFGISYDLGPAAREVELTLNIEGVRR